MVETREQRRVRGKMEHFVRYLTKIMPLSSLTQNILRDSFKLIVFKKQMTVAHYETLERVFVEVSKEELNKDFQNSEWKIRPREAIFKVLRQQRKLEKQNEDLARLEEEVARKRKKVAVGKMLHDKLDRLREQIDLHLDQFERIRDDASAAPEKIATLTMLAKGRVLDVIHGLRQEFERIHDESCAISYDQ